MNRTSALAPLVLASALALTLAGTTAGAIGVPARTPAPVAKGSPGNWTKISQGTIGTNFAASLARGSDGTLHVLYPVTVSFGTQLSQTALHTNGTVAGRANSFLPTPWEVMDTNPVLVSSSAGLRAMFVGFKDVNPGFWSRGMDYTATADASGSTWTLPGDQTVGHATGAESDGTAGTVLADGTPVGGYPSNTSFIWHVGTTETDADASFTFGAPMASAAMVRDGSTVWVAWDSSGSTAATTGTFVRQIEPTIGSVMKAPGSSSGTFSVPTGRVALAARTGGGVYAAYCVGSANCANVRLWKVGSNQSVDVPHSKFAQSIALSSAPSGRLWVAWADNLPKVHAVRTGTNGLAMGAVQAAGIPRGGAAFALAIEGSRGRGDIVLNDGAGLWHTQVLPGLTLHASPSRWQHGRRQKVVFGVTDAHADVRGAKVKVGTSTCRTDRHGTCSITFPASYAKGKHAAKATKSQYAAATTGLRVS